jgi:hypothetical protein
MVKTCKTHGFPVKIFPNKPIQHVKLISTRRRQRAEGHLHRHGQIFGRPLGGLHGGSGGARMGPPWGLRGSTFPEHQRWDDLNHPEKWRNMNWWLALNLIFQGKKQQISAGNSVNVVWASHAELFMVAWCWKGLVLCPRFGQTICNQSLILCLFCFFPIKIFLTGFLTKQSTVVYFNLTRRAIYKLQESPAAVLLYISRTQPWLAEKSSI